MFQEGDIVEIPLPDGRTAIGWILHLSTHFKNAVGFVVFGIKGEKSDQIVQDADAGQPLSLKVLGPLYTHVDNMKHCGWKTFAHQPISDSQRLLTKREVGGGVYVGDEYVGSVHEVGDPNLQPMRTMGMPIVYGEIEKAFGKREPT
ncbi:hypothetical protein [Blastopirellula marina]|uniref:Uncharacterized protein n=1 Tax=Blastopirellula marina TaxID=124 RepID=A0A2S8GQH6_9BACT|nr:hypothetical protein [Blastopirellula marina]PQO46688.1 hypothetical protein C5Y93_07590 [Blastopirellula marina]